MCLELPDTKSCQLVLLSAVCERPESAPCTGDPLRTGLAPLTQQRKRLLKTVQAASLDSILDPLLVPVPPLQDASPQSRVLRARSTSSQKLGVVVTPARMSLQAALRESCWLSGRAERSTEMQSPASSS
eukprot:CAMPEP_0115055550 /NCGR_PEP_ID=MMETSP0227-20121206/4711_1 /TAXON_ID=89957 /ORGANISM="Polarella glacialis, Strain CCMP 1383" /LENGTH=128 /DNA_ID=CAMNT_0002440147 /DNA_START=187 /DNA_END=574 /DNA_ORIENTATION=-